MVSHFSDSDLAQDLRVRAVLAAAAAPTEPGPLPGELEAVAAFRAAQPRTRRKLMPTSLTVRAAVAAGLGTGLIVAGGVGAAAAGALPGAAQETARTWLETVGVEVPGANARSAGHADQRGRSAEAGTAGGADATARTETEAEPTPRAARETAPEADKELPTASEHGQTVSGTARETELEGAEKGRLVSETAKSKSRSRTGDDSAADSSTRQENADPADAGAAGRAKADEASGGRRHNAGEQRP